MRAGYQDSYEEKVSGSQGREQVEKFRLLGLRFAELNGVHVRDPTGFRIHLGGDAVAFAARHVALLLQFQHAGVELVGIPFADDHNIVHAVIIDRAASSPVAGAGFCGQAGRIGEARRQRAGQRLQLMTVAALVAAKAVVNVRRAAGGLAARAAIGLLTSRAIVMLHAISPCLRVNPGS